MSLLIVGSQRMAYKRSLSTQAAMLAPQARTFNPFLTHISQYDQLSGSKIDTLFATQVRSLRLNPSSTCISPSNERKKPEDLHSSGSKIESFSSQMKSLRFRPSSTYSSKTRDVLSSGSKKVTFLAQRKTLGSYLSHKTFSPTPYGLFGNGVSLRREISISAFAKEAANAFEVFMEVASSSLPVVAVENLIDGVHSVTGLNWWASIVIATLLVRGATFPFIIDVQRKLILARTDVISEWVRRHNQEIAMGMEPQAVGEGKKRVNKLNREGVAYEAMVHSKEMLIHTFFFGGFTLAISNMAGKVASFKTGGALWFTDLSAPDAMYILPILLSLTYLIRMEYVNDKRKLVSIVGSMQDRVLALLCIPLTMYFPSALLCFGIATRMFTLCFRYVTLDPEVQKAWGLLVVRTFPPPPSYPSTKDTGALRLRDKWH